MDQSQTPTYVSRFESLLYIPAFTQKDFHYTSTQDVPHREPPLRIWVNTTLEYTTPLSNNNNLYTRGKPQQQSPLHLEGWALSQTTTITFTLREIPTNPLAQPPIHLEGKAQSQSKEKGYNSW